MRIKLLSVLTGLLFLTSGQASADGWYAGIEGAQSIQTHKEYPGMYIGGWGGPEIIWSYKDGLYYGGFVGYDFGLIKVEAEYTTGTHDALRWTYGGVGAGTYAMNGSMKRSTFMGNILLQHDFGGWKGYAGGGAGTSTIDVNVAIPTYFGGNSFVFKTNSVATYQYIVGILYPLTESVAIGARYKYVTGSNYVKDPGIMLLKFPTVHELGVTIQYGF